MRRSIVPAGVAAILFVTTVLRLSVGRSWPLWLDETWTGVIVSQASFLGAIRQMHQDVSAPLYYLVTWALHPLIGISDDALRFPARCFGAAAPFTCLLLIGRREVRWQWCLLSACWIGGIVFSAEARGYSLLWLLCTISTAAFANALDEPTWRRATVWVVATSLAVLTHYFALFLAAGQAISFLAIHRRRALRLWPVSLAAAPALAWLAWHAPRVLQYSSPKIAWYSLFRLNDFVVSAETLFGGYVAGATALLVVFLLRRRPSPPPWPAQKGAQTSAGVAIMSLNR